MGKLKVKYQNKIIILSSVSFFLLLLIIFLLFIKNDNKKIEQNFTVNIKSEERAELAKPETFSRISMFNSYPVKISIAMPSSWEGKYRTTEIGGKAHIQYIGNLELPTNLLQFGYYEKNAKFKENETVLFSENNLTITYLKMLNNPYQGIYKEEYDSMLARLDEILKDVIIIK